MAYHAPYYVDPRPVKPGLYVRHVPRCGASFNVYLTIKRVNETLGNVTTDEGYVISISNLAYYRYVRPL